LPFESIFAMFISAMKKIKLKSETWYYIYTDGKDVFISEDAPVRSDENHNWYHPSYKWKICGSPIKIGDPESSENIQDFFIS